MELLVREGHDGWGSFPQFAKGTPVDIVGGDSGYPLWLSCVIGGYETFVPETWVGDGVLNRDYDPTELIVARGQRVTLVEIVFGWIVVEDGNGTRGWLPASKVVSA